MGTRLAPTVTLNCSKLGVGARVVMLKCPIVPLCIHYIMLAWVALGVRRVWVGVVILTCLGEG
jgi:hypothetical protein